MINLAMEEFKNSEHVNIFVSGAILTEKGSISKRKFVESLLERKCCNNTNVHFKWPDPGVESIEIILDPNNGKCYTNESSN